MIIEHPGASYGPFLFLSSFLFFSHRFLWLLQSVFRLLVLNVLFSALCNLNFSHRHSFQSGPEDCPGAERFHSAARFKTQPLLPRLGRSHSSRLLDQEWFSEHYQCRDDGWEQNTDHRKGRFIWRGDVRLYGEERGRNSHFECRRESAR